MRKSLLFLLFFIINLSVYSAKGTDDIIFRSFDQEKMDEYKTNSNFYYLEPAPSGLWDRFLEWLIEKLKGVFKNVPDEQISSILSIAIKVVLWGLGIFAVVMVVTTLFKQGAFSVIQKSDKEIELKSQNLEDQVLETNWQELIDIEIENRRFNVALRLLFLQTIQLLNEKKLINWEKNKTNFDYLRELHKTSFDKSFRKLMQYYNFGWFGGFEIKELNFNEIHLEFKSFNTSVE